MGGVKKTRKPAVSDYDKIVNSGAYKLHHTVKASGYVSHNCILDNNFRLVPYQGRFGKGFIAEIPLPDTTYYYVKEYWIKVE